MQIKNKNKSRLPTEEEFALYVPNRINVEWKEDKDGLVTLIVPKFDGKVGKSFLKIIRKDNIFSANMDKLGSLVWKSCDGKNNVGDILKIVKKKFPKEKNINNRLYLFLQQLQNLNYITFS